MGIEYYKGEAEQILLRIAQRAHNRPLMMLVLESQRDPEHLIMPFGCGRCDYQTKRVELPMSKVLSDAFTKGGLVCPHCGKVTKSKKKTAEKLMQAVIALTA